MDTAQARVPGRVPDSVLVPDERLASGRGWSLRDGAAPRPLLPRVLLGPHGPPVRGGRHERSLGGGPGGDRPGREGRAARGPRRPCRGRCPCRRRGNLRGPWNVNLRAALVSSGGVTRGRSGPYWSPARKDGVGVGTGVGGLAVEPDRHHPAAVVEAVVGPVVLHVRLPCRHDLLRGVIEIVGVVRRVALDVEDEIPALPFVEGTPL